MHNPEQPLESESEPRDLRAQIKNEFADEFESITVEDRRTAEQNPDENFRLRLSSQPTNSQLAEIDKSIIDYYQAQYDADLMRDEKSSGSNQRSVELVSDKNRIVIIRTNHGTNIEITTKITEKEA